MIHWLREVFLHDFRLKLFSLVLASLTWMVVNFAVQRDNSPAAPLVLGNVQQRVFPKIPVIVMSSAEDVRSVRVHPKEVDVTVQGDARLISQLDARDIHVLVDLTGIPAAHDLRKRVEVSTRPGVTLLRVEPEEVQVIFPR